MNKLLLLATTILISAAPLSAQVEHANRVILHHKDGTTQVFKYEDLDYLDFDFVGTVSVNAEVTEGSIEYNSFAIDVTPSYDCASYTVSYTGPDSAEPVDMGTFTKAETVEFTGLQHTTTYTVTITPYDKYGESGVVNVLNITTMTKIDLDALPAPKVGDYFYSDGSWSDGGLISIDKTGLNAVWAETKPAPIEGKTVIGIVCITDPDRINQADRDAGYTRGYVIACKNATDPRKDNFARYPETLWFGGHNQELDFTQVAKLGTTCYERTSGYIDTREMLANLASPHIEAPLFYYGTQAFPVSAPSTTSGWFIPAVGQMWDCVANFCSGEVAETLLSLRTYKQDITWKEEQTGVNVFQTFMKVFDLVPDKDKDAITYYDLDSRKAVSFWTSTRYDGESALTVDLGDLGTGDDAANPYMQGCVEVMCEWYDYDAHARPMLAF